MQNDKEKDYRVRKLEIQDNANGFTKLLSQLTVCDAVSDKEFEDRFQEISHDDHLICVIEDANLCQIVATGSVLIEKKFIRRCWQVGHIEDVVVDKRVRGKNLGKKIVDFLVAHARSKGWYKVILDFSLDNAPFYEKCGFKRKEIQMVQYFM